MSLNTNTNWIDFFLRQQIIDDALKLAQHSYLSYETALNIVQYLQKEIDYPPWKAVFYNFDYILDRFKPNEVSIFEVNTRHRLECEKRMQLEWCSWLNRINNYLKLFYQEYELKLLDRVYNRLGFQPKANDTRLDIYNRNHVIKYACKFGHKQCVNDARAEFDKLLEGNYS